VILHAGCLALRVDGLWRGVLLSGPSGAGKSDLALRLLERGWRLVSDDRTVVWTDGRRLFGRAPDALTGLIEARGLDVLRVLPLPFAGLALRVDCGEEPERLPEPRTIPLLGVHLPTMRLSPAHASATAKVSQALFAAARLHPLESSGGERI